jgi:short-subunit dehydrogenase
MRSKAEMMGKFIRLREQVLIITGAETKIGFETARYALLNGAKIVLVANSEESLQQISDQINMSGDVVFVKADVSHEKDVQRIADTTIRTFGGFDCWVNISSGPIFKGSGNQLHEADLKQAEDTDFWGAVFGSRSAAKFFVESMKRGTIINVDSFTMHADSLNRARHHASRQAVKSWTDGLRVELDKIKSNVSVSLILPGELKVDDSEEKRKLLYEEVAAAILYSASHQKREIYVGSHSKFMTLLKENAPLVVNKLKESASSLNNGFHQERKSPGPDEDIKKPDKRFPDFISYYHKASRHPILSTIVIAGIGAGLWMLGKKKR